MFEKIKFVAKGTIVIFVAILFASSLAQANALDDIYKNLDSTSENEIFMIVGELTIAKVSNMTRLSITDPEIADIVEADDKEILLIAKSPGQTILFVWDDAGKRMVFVNVQAADMTMLDNAIGRIETLFKKANIEGLKLEPNKREGKIFITGDIDEDKQEVLETLLEGYGDIVLNLVRTEEIKDLIQVDMQMTELSTTLTKSLGIDWATGSDSGIALAYPEDPPVLDGSLGDFFKIGDFSRTSVLTATVNALLEKGEARVLSRPKVVVMSGEEVTFLVGGEIPIKTTTATAEGTQENVSFKEYGIGLSLTPTVEKEKIDVELNVEISDVAAGTGNETSFFTQTTTTHVLLDNQQTMVLAGLIKENRGTSMRKVPFLSDIPVVGLLFRSKGTNPADTDRELVISMTPTIVARNRNTPIENVEEKITEYSSSATYKQKVSNSAVVPYYLGIPKDMTEYVREVQKQISKTILYPPEAKRYGWEGTVRMNMLILKDGTLAYALIQESSGHEAMDESALRAAKRIAPYAAFPVEVNLQELNITVPIVYSFKR